MIDCHCHFYPPQFAAAEIPALAGAAAAAGVRAVVVVPESLADCEQVLALCSQQHQQQPVLLPCAGLHPVQPLHGPEQHYASQRSVQAVAEVEPVLQFIRHHADSLVAIGEVGLDFSPHILQPQQQQPPDDAASSPQQAGSCSSTPEELRAVQLAVFQQQIALANELDLPLNVHSRSAGHHAIDCLTAGGARRALLHAFDGKLKHAQRGAAAGFFFSVPPIVVRSPHMQQLVTGLPLESLVLETDAPALAPERGAVNALANLAVAAAEVARLRSLPLEEVVRVTTANAHRLFPKAARLMKMMGGAADSGGGLEQQA